MPEGYRSNGSIDVSWWIEQVQKGKEWRKKMALEDRWPTWRRWGRGEFDAGCLPSNIYFKAIRSLVPRTYFRNPSISVSTTKPGMEQLLLAKLIERMDNNLIDIMGVKGQMKRMVLHATMFGTGFVRRGFGAEFTPTPAPITTEGPDVGSRRRQLKVEYNSLVRKDQPWLLCAHPNQLVLPAWCTDIDSARWVCYETTRPKNDIIKDPRFAHTDELQDGVKGVGGTQIVKLNDRRRMDGVVTWEIRDKKAGIVFVLFPYGLNAKTQAPQAPAFEAEDKLQRNGRLPVYPLIFNQDDENFWGIPDSIIIEPQQIEKNEIRTQLKYHRRIMLLKLLYEKGSISPDELSKLLADDNVNVAVQVTGANGINSVRPIEPIPLPSGLVEMEALVDKEVEEILGLGVNQFGEFAPGSADRSATEANIVNQATQIRIDERRDACADLLVSFIEDMNDDIAEYWDESMVLDIAGPGGVPIWIKFQPDLLKNGRYDIKVDPDSNVPLTREYREQKAVVMRKELQGDPNIDPRALTEFTLSQVYGFEADMLLSNPAMQTTQQNPMQLAEAAKHLHDMHRQKPQLVPQPQPPRVA